MSASEMYKVQTINESRKQHVMNAYFENVVFFKVNRWIIGCLVPTPSANRTSYIGPVL